MNALRLADPECFCDLYLRNRSFEDLRLGPAGAGYISEFHVRALQRLAEVGNVVLTDADEGRALFA